jgi:predicted transcriptional regulator
MSSTTVSVRIDPASKKRLEKLAKSTGRSRSFLAAQAINEYLDLNEWQEDAARVLSEMEEQDASPYRLTDEQVAEVKRRLADPNPKFLTLEEVRERFAQRRA